MFLCLYGLLREVMLWVEPSCLKLLRFQLLGFHLRDNISYISFFSVVGPLQIVAIEAEICIVLVYSGQF